MGRPIKITDDVVRILEGAFAKGLSDEKACLLADIGISTLYDYCKAHPKFSERKEILKKKPAMKAQINIAEAIDDGNIEISKWYLERKEKDEFSTKQGVEVSGNVELSAEDKRRIMRQRLEELRNDTE